MNEINVLVVSGMKCGKYITQECIQEYYVKRSVAVNIALDWNRDLVVRAELSRYTAKKRATVVCVINKMKHELLSSPLMSSAVISNTV